MTKTIPVSDEYNKNWRKRNRVHIRDYMKRYRIEHKEEIKKWQREYSISHRITSREWKKKDYEKNRVERLVHLKRMRSEYDNHTNHLLQTSMWKCIRNGHEWRKGKELLGYTISDVKRHIEKQFIVEMNWKNYGKVWSIDHLIPKAELRYTTVYGAKFKNLWGIENLRPLLIQQNRIKAARKEEVFRNEMFPL